MKDLNCPFCKKTQIVVLGLNHDLDGNVLCQFCNKMVFSVTEEGEKKIRAAFQPTSHYGYSRKEPIPIKGGEEDSNNQIMTSSQKSAYLV